MTDRLTILDESSPWTEQNAKDAIEILKRWEIMEKRLSEDEVRDFLSRAEFADVEMVCEELLDLRRKLGWHGGEMPEDEIPLEAEKWSRDDPEGSGAKCPRCGRQFFINGGCCEYCDRAQARYWAELDERERP